MHLCGSPHFQEWGSPKAELWTESRAWELCAGKGYVSGRELMQYPEEGERMALATSLGAYTLFPFLRKNQDLMGSGLPSPPSRERIPPRDVPEPVLIT